MITTLGICAAYLAAGSTVWRKLVIHQDHGSQLASCETRGGLSLGEDAAFLMTKATFLVLWPLWLLLFIGCRVRERV
ncbi:hypothetical protein MBLL_03355 [Methylobacterium bullatum]|uniref:Uncharacterized protein n=1 Tax=Methylobacterium bullatum TaxID=570505 RepID=A0A679K469_9HYPH|nr:hypothetical protein MBLL_03355 [Methylobacterium bullatum]